MKTKTAIENLLSYLEGYGTERTVIPVSRVIEKTLEYQEREQADTECPHPYLFVTRICDYEKCEKCGIVLCEG